MDSYKINEFGLLSIAKFLNERHLSGTGRGFTEDMIFVWGVEAEDKINDGQPPVVEISSWDSISGNPELFEVPAEGFDVVLPADSVDLGGWLIDGSLIYKLDEQGINCDEINVTMANGSRSAEDRARKAVEVLDSIKFAESMSARKWQTPLGKPLEPRRVGIFKKPPLSETPAFCVLRVEGKDTK